MHYKNGREAKVGDRVLNAPSWHGAKPETGVVVSITPGATTCNADLVPLNTTPNKVNLSDCIHLDDVEARALAAASEQVDTAAAPAAAT